MKTLLVWLAFLLGCAWGTDISEWVGSSGLVVRLSSRERSLLLPPRLPCSCRMSVLSVYNDSYQLELQSGGGHSHFRVMFGSREPPLCLSLPANASSPLTLMQVTVPQFNGYELTERFWVEGYWGGGEEGCEGIEERGEERAVYLVNRTRECVEGEYQYIINLPMAAIGVTQLGAMVVLLVLTNNIKYRRFTPIAFGLPLALVYAVFLFVTVYLEAYIDDELQITYWLVMAFSLFCTGLYLVDLWSLCVSQRMPTLVLSLLTTLTLALLDLVVFPDAWPLNGVLGVLVAGALIKFVVIKRIRSAVIPLGLLWAFFLFRQCIVFLHLQNFEQALETKLVPLFLQVPALLGDDPLAFGCSAFATSKLVTLGLVLNYCVRVDLFLSTRFYTILTAVLAAGCLGAEYLVQLLLDDMPVMEYTSVILFLPLALLLVLLLAAKRGEWAEIWHGSFHDIAVDRKSIRRESEIDQAELDRHLQQLRMNPSLLSSL